MAGVAAVWVTASAPTPSFPARLWIGHDGSARFDPPIRLWLEPGVPSKWIADIPAVRRGAPFQVLPWAVRWEPTSAQRWLEAVGLIDRADSPTAAYEGTWFSFREGAWTWFELVPPADVARSPERAEEIAGTWEHTTGDGGVRRLTFVADGTVEGFGTPARWRRWRDRICVTLADPSGRTAQTAAEAAVAWDVFGARLDATLTGYTGQDLKLRATTGRRTEPERVK